jgi:hypothetical protein
MKNVFQELRKRAVFCSLSSSQLSIIVIIRSALSMELPEYFPVAGIFSTADRIRAIWVRCFGLSRE